MRNQNRFLALLVVLCLLLPLAGCVGALPAPTPTPTATPTAMPTPTPTATPEPTASPSPEPIGAAFALGVGDETGYLSKYFDFGFRLPEGWAAYDRKTIDAANMVKSDISDTEAYDQEYLALLKSGQTLYDYVGYRKTANEMILVLLKDNSDNGMGAASEQQAVDAYAASICDIGGDGTNDAKNVRTDTIKIGNTEHPMIRFELPFDKAYAYCAVFAVLLDDTIAFVNMMCPDEETLQSVIDSIYRYSDFPSLDAYTMPTIGEQGFDSDFLGLSFDKPAEWGYYSREKLDGFNKPPVSGTGKDALTQSYRDLLKSGDLVMEYAGFEKDLKHVVFVYSSNSTGNWMESVSSRDFFETLLPWLLDFDKDGSIDVLNGSYSIETLMGQDCYVFRFDDREGRTGVMGMLFSYRHGSSFVGIEISSVVPGEIEKILPLFSVPK